MDNRKGFNRLGRKPSHRKALHRNMVTSLIKNERIETTQAKAKEIRRTAEKLVTRAKIDSVHNRRIAAKTIYEKDALNKLFTEVGPRFSERPGGYTRILKLGRRSGDAAEMVILEFLGEDESLEPKKSASKKASAKKKSGGGKAAPKAEKTGDKAPKDAPKDEAPVGEAVEAEAAEKPEEVEAQGAEDDAPEADDSVQDENDSSKDS